MKLSPFAAAPVLTALLVTASPAGAQQDRLTSGAINQYFSRLQQQAVEMMKTGNFERITEWTKENISDSAQFNILVEVLREDEPKMWSAIMLNKSDMQDMQAFVGHIAGDAIQEYSLDVEVDDITLHGPDAATVTATWNDRGTIMMPMPQQGMASRGQTGRQSQEMVGQAPSSAQGRTFSFRREFECSHLIVREEGRIKMGMMTCNGQAQF